MKLAKAAAAFAMTCALALASTFGVTPLFAADYPAPQQGEWIAKDFKFHTGEVMKELKLHYTTVGDPKGKPVLVLHGTGGSAQSMLGAGFAGAMFGPGQPLDATKYYIIIPDAIGAGHSSKPSDGLRAKFPHYNYDDMVTAQYLLLKDGLGIKHLRLVIGNSMGGMHTWMWTTKYPGYMDAAAPMASQPTPMASRNWMMRRMLIEAVRRTARQIPEIQLRRHGHRTASADQGRPRHQTSAPRHRQFDGRHADLDVGDEISR